MYSLKWVCDPSVIALTNIVHSEPYAGSRKHSLGGDYIHAKIVSSYQDNLLGVQLA